VVVIAEIKVRIIVENGSVSLFVCSDRVYGLTILINFQYLQGTKIFGI